MISSKKEKKYEYIDYGVSFLDKNIFKILTKLKDLIYQY